MEPIGRTFRVGSKLILKLLEGTLEGVIPGVLKCVGPEKLDVLHVLIFATGEPRDEPRYESRRQHEKDNGFEPNIGT